MIFRNIFWILASLSLTNAFTISERFAKQVLSRVKRANAGEETFRRSDLDRECLDEQCSAEEYLEYRVFFLKCQLQKWKAKFLAKKKAMLGRSWVILSSINYFKSVQGSYQFQKGNFMSL